MDLEVLTNYTTADSLFAVAKIASLIVASSFLRRDWLHRSMVVMLAVAAGAYVDKGCGGATPLRAIRCASSSRTRTLRPTEQPEAL